MHSTSPGPQLLDLDSSTRSYAPLPSEFCSRFPKSNKALKPTERAYGSWKRRSSVFRLELKCGLALKTPGSFCGSYGAVGVKYRVRAPCRASPSPWIQGEVG